MDGSYWHTGLVPRVATGESSLARAVRILEAFTPDEPELVRFERTLEALWTAIARATEARDFRASPSRLCEWCSYQSCCPAFGGTPPAYPMTAPTPHLP